MTTNTTFFLLLRLAIASSMLGHGLVRIPKVRSFSTWMVGNFQKSAIPKTFVMAFSYALPFLEFAIGLLLLVGLFTATAATVGGLLMVALIFGTCLIENWEALPSQFIHLIFYAALLHFIEYNTLSLDNLFKT